MTVFLFIAGAPPAALPSRRAPHTEIQPGLCCTCLPVFPCITTNAPTNIWCLRRYSLPMHVTGRTAASPRKTMRVVSQGWTPPSIAQPVATSDAEEASPFPRHHFVLEKAMCPITEAAYCLSDAGSDDGCCANGDFPGHNRLTRSCRTGHLPFLAAFIRGKPARPRR